MISFSSERAFAEPVFNDFFGASGGGYGFRAEYYFNASDGKWAPRWEGVDPLNEGYSIVGRYLYPWGFFDGKQNYIYHFDMDKSAPYRGLAYTNCRETASGDVLVCDEQYMSFDCSAGQPRLIAHIGSPEFSLTPGHIEMPPTTRGCGETNTCGLKILEFTYEPEILYYGPDMLPYISISGRVDLDAYFVNLEVANYILGVNVYQGNDPYFDFDTTLWIGTPWGFIIEPGTYPMTLTISNSTCAVSKTIDIVVPDYYPSECSYRIPNVPLQIRQCDARYNAGGIVYDDSCRVAADGSTRCETICGKGCALASLTMLMSSKGCNEDLLTVNGCKECFSGTSVDWGRTLSKYCPSVIYLPAMSNYGRNLVNFQSILPLSQLKQDIESSYRYALNVRGSDGKCSHFVLLKGISDDCNSLDVIDPGNKRVTVNEICGFRIFK